MVKTVLGAIGRVLEIVIVLLWELLFGRSSQGRKDLASRGRPEPETESQKAGHEVSEPSPKAILIFVGCFFVTILGSMAVLGFLYTKLYRDRPASPVPKAEASFRYAPKAETSIARDWDDINEQAKRRLETYGWIDGKNGIVRIPIERASKLIARQGLPSRQGKPPAFWSSGLESPPIKETEKVRDGSKSF